VLGEYRQELSRCRDENDRLHLEMRRQQDQGRPRELSTTPERDRRPDATPHKPRAAAGPAASAGSTNDQPKEKTPIVCYGCGGSPQYASSEIAADEIASKNWPPTQRADILNRRIAFRRHQLTPMHN